MEQKINGNDVAFVSSVTSTSSSPNGSHHLQNNTNSISLKKLSREGVVKLVEVLEKMKLKGLHIQDPNRYALLLKILRAQTQYYQVVQSHQQSVTTTTIPSGVSQHQVNQLNAQLVAYKYLSKNQPLPPKLLAAIRNHNASTILSKPSPIPVQTVASSLKPEQDSNIPDPSQFLQQERDKRIKARIIQRLEDLDALPQDLPFSLKRRAAIEQKQLKLLDLQKKVRAQVIDKLRRIVESESSSVDTSVYRRAGRKVVKEAAKVMPTRLSTKMDTEQQKTQRHQEFLGTVMRHCKDFKDFHAARAKKMKKLSKDILNYHTNEARKQQQEEERQKRARLNALKENNEEEYLKLLEQAKSERLALLLKETDRYLEKISAMISLQKDYDEIADKKKQIQDRKAKQKKKKEEKEKGKSDEKEEKEDKEEDKEKEDTSTVTTTTTTDSENKSQEGTNKTSVNAAATLERNRKYYTTAHSIQETITEQPKLIEGGKLKPYQLVGVQWLVSLYNNKLNGILADEMGLGKTIQTLALIAYLMEKKGDNGPYLIVVPLSTLSNWAMEFKKWAPTVSVVIYKGKPQSRKQIYKEELAGGKFNVLLTSYEYVMLDKSDLSKIEWCYIVIDEGHRIKNKNSKLSNVLRQYMCRHRLLLTGTPLQNDLGELWSLLNFLLPNIFNSADNFEQWFNAPFQYGIKKGKTDLIQPNEEETLLIINRLHKVLRPFLLRRLKTDVENELPEKIETILKCDLSAMQNRMYKLMVERGVLLSDPEHAKQKGRKNTKGFNNIIMQLQKICNHPYLFREEWDIDINVIRASGKFDLLDRILPKLRRADHRVLIFNQMTQLMTILEDYFSIRGFEYLRLDGSTKAEDRAELVRLWNTPNSPHWLFILSTKAGGLGLNLQTADTVIIFDTDWNPMMDLQAQDRVHRIGQSKTVRVFRLITNNSIEERILERASFKLDVDAKVIQAGMFNTNASDAMRRQMLEQLLRESEENKEESELITSDNQVNALLAGGDDKEYELYQMMDKERESNEDRAWRHAGNKGPRPPRLMQEEELPEWLKTELPEPDDELQIYGRGMRSRKEVVYDDGLSENQFARMLEGETIEKQKEDSEDLSSESETSATEGQLEDHQSKKRRREEGEEDQDPESLHGKLNSLWNRLATATSANGTLLSKPFLKLPSKRDVPEYYRMIKQAISMEQIKKRIPSYRGPWDMKNDFSLLLKNAQTFNNPATGVYQQSKALQQLFDQEFPKLFPPMEASSPQPVFSPTDNFMDVSSPRDSSEE